MNCYGLSRAPDMKQGKILANGAHDQLMKFLVLRNPA